MEQLSGLALCTGMLLAVAKSEVQAVSSRPRPGDFSMKNYRRILPKRADAEARELSSTKTKPWAW